MLAIGCHCTSAYAFFAVLHDGLVADDRMTRLKVQGEMERDEAVAEFLGQLDGELVRLRPDVLAVLRPVYGQRTRPYTPRDASVAFDRGALVGLVLAAAARRQVPVRALTPPRARSLCSMPRTGALDDHVSALFPEDHPPYWSDRRMAAFVAQAASR